MRQPDQALHSGHYFQPAILLSTRSTQAKKQKPVNTSNLVACVSLLGQTTSGNWAPFPSGILIGAQLVSGVKALPEAYLNKLDPRIRDRAVGFLSFPNLSVHRPGVYRLRTTLVKLADVREERQGHDNLVDVDSAPFRVYVPSSSDEDDD